MNRCEYCGKETHPTKERPDMCDDCKYKLETDPEFMAKPAKFRDRSIYRHRPNTLITEKQAHEIADGANDGEL